MKLQVVEILGVCRSCYLDRREKTDSVDTGSSRAIGFIVALMALVSPLAYASTDCLSEVDEEAAFTVAGYARKDDQWRACSDPGTPSYVPGAIREVRDLNGDGLPEVVITESSVYCYGYAGAAFSVVSKKPDGSWSLVTNGVGIPDFLSNHGSGDWPDIEIGGPGFCFPVLRWDGLDYVLHRHQYEGAACRIN